jgi:DNA-binding IclR family transcriptional regulator
MPAWAASAFRSSAAAIRWIAALSVSGPLAGTPFRLDARHRELVRKAAAEISRRLALQPSADSDVGA